MSILWPGSLILLSAIPVLIILYVWMLQKRRKFAVRYSSLSLIRPAIRKHSNLRRYLPIGLFLTALSSLVLAFSRPVAYVPVPDGDTTIILAMDVSRSMLAADIAPSRLIAAEKAALAFIQSQVSGTQIGIVVFAGFAELILPPTDDQEALQSAIESLTTARRTAIGSGILESLDAIHEAHPNIAPSSLETGSLPIPNTGGDFPPAIIVLLTDGASNTGPLPVDAAQQAAERGIRVYTIGFGSTEENTPFGESGRQGDNPYDGRQQGGSEPGFGWRFSRALDEETLNKVSEITQGEYYHADSASELQQVFQDLPITVATHLESIEISVTFVALGTLLITLAIILSFLWHPLL